MFVVAFDRSLITYSSVEEAIEANKNKIEPDGSHLLVYRIEVAGVVNPVQPLTGDGIDPNGGGTPIAMRKAA